MTGRRCFPTLFVQDIERARAFYVELFGFDVAFDSRWFVNLRFGSDGAELGLMARDHELVPEGHRGRPAGVMLTFEVEDVDAVHARAREDDVRVVEPPEDRFYGQRRMILEDPEGTLVDVSSPCPPDPEWMARVRPSGQGSYVETD